MKSQKINKKIQKCLSFLLIFSFVTSWSYGLIPGLENFSPETKTAEAASAWNLRQEINILDSYLVAPASTIATSSEIIRFDPTKYSGTVSYYLEIVASTSASFSNTVTLRRNGNSTDDCTVTIPTNTNTAYTLIRSSACSLTSAQNYVLRISSNAGGTTGVKAARLIILQSFAGTANSAATSTQTQIEIGSATTTATNTTTLPLQYPKYWTYDSTKWDGTLTFSVDVSFKNTQTSSSTLYTTATTTTTNTTYIASPSVSYVTVEAWGAGGGGSIGNAGGGGGGGGAYAKSIFAISAGTSKALVIPAGGPTDNNGTIAHTSYGSNEVVAGNGTGDTANGIGVGGSLVVSVGQVEYSGGDGGLGHTTGDVGGGGGGAGGPNGNGVAAAGAIANTPTAGGNGNNNSGGAGGAAGTGTTCPGATGGAGVNNVLGAGGGGGADAAGAGACPGGAGGYPGGGGGSSEFANTVQYGGAGQIKLTEIHGAVGIALQEDDGNFGSWTFKTQVISSGVSTSTTSTTRSASFTPTNGRHYRLVASSTSASASYDIYNAKIVVDQNITNWTQVGNGLTITAGGPALTALSSTRVAYFDETLDSLRTYDFDGTNWTQVGNGLTITGASFPALTALSSTRVAYFDSLLDSLRTYDFNESPEITKLEPQYLLANTKLGTGTALQKFLTKWDSSEWTGTVNTYLHAIDSNAGSSVVEIDSDDGGTGTQVPNSSITATKVHATSTTGLTMPANGNLDVKATTNNDTIYGSRILVQVGLPSAPTVSTQSASSVTATTAVLNGTIETTGGASPTIRGFATSTTSTLLTDVSTTTESGTFTTGTFTKTDSVFVCNTAYYYRAYATNSVGTGYGAISGPFTTSACGLTISGVAYQSEGGAVATSKAIKVYRNGATLIGSATSNVSTGAWSASLSPAPTSGDILTAYIDNDAIDANTVFVSDGTAKSNVDLYGDSLIVRKDTAGGSITNANLFTGAVYGEADMIYATSSTANITLNTNANLHVYTGNTYSAGGTLTTQGTGNFRVATSSIAFLDVTGNTIGGDVVAYDGSLVYINANTAINGGDIKTQGTSNTGNFLYSEGTFTPTVTLSGTGSIADYNATSTFYALTISGTGAITASSTFTMANALTINASGNLSPGNGIVTMNNGSSIANSGTLVFNKLILPASATVTTGSSFSVGDVLTVNSSANLSPSAGTITMTGGSITNSGTLAFKNLTIAGTVTTSSTFSVTGDMTSTSGTLTTSGGTITITGDMPVAGTITGTGSITVNGGDITGNGTLNLTSGTLTLDGTGLFGGNTGWTFNELKFGDGTGVATTTSTGTGSVTLATTTVSANQIFDAGVNKTWNLTASFEPFQMLGTFLASTSLVSYQGTNNATVTPTTYYNLDLSPPSGTMTYGLATTSGQTITVNNNFTIGGSGNVTVDANTRDPNIDVNGAFSIGTGDTFSASNSAAFSVAGNFTNNGTFTNNSGTLTLDTTNTSIISSTANMTFYNMSVTTPGKILKFGKHTANVPTFSFDNLFTVTGGVNNLIQLQSDTPGSQWMVDFNFAQNAITFIFLRDAACAIGSLSVTYSGTNSAGGNNGSCWNIGNVGADGTQTVTSVEQGSGGGILRGGGVVGGGSSVEGGSGGGILCGGVPCVGVPGGGGGGTP